MPEEILLIVNPDGTVAVVGETPAAQSLFGGQIATAATRRASHVEPISPALRAAFRLLRWLGGENGRLAAFTRSWRCQWRADMAPSRGPLLQPFSTRAAAIAAEIDWLAQNA